MTDTTRYPLTLFWSDEDSAFIAEARDLPGCCAVGDSQQEAIEEAQDAIVSWIEAATAAGKQVPPPSPQAGESAYSGRLLVRMPRSLHAALARRAEAEGVSLNQWVVYLLSGQMQTPQQTQQIHRAGESKHSATDEVVRFLVGSPKIKSQHVSSARDFFAQFST